VAPISIRFEGFPVFQVSGSAGGREWLEYRLLKDDKFLDRIAESRRQYKEGKYKTLEELP
jgi:hypothetical protein